MMSFHVVSSCIREPLAIAIDLSVNAYLC